MGMVEATGEVALGVGKGEEVGGGGDGTEPGSGSDVMGAEKKWAYGKEGSRKESVPSSEGLQAER